MQQSVGELVFEDLGVVVGGEVAVLLARFDVGQHDPVDELTQGTLPCLGVQGTPEVLRRDDRPGIDRPEVRELDTALLEDRLAGLPVGLHDVTQLPGDLVIRVHARRRVDAWHGHSCAFVRSGAAPGGAVGGFSHARAPWCVSCVERLSSGGHGQCPQEGVAVWQFGYAGP